MRWRSTSSMFFHCALGRPVLTHQNDEALGGPSTYPGTQSKLAQAYFAQGFNLLWYGREIEAETLLDRATMLSPPRRPYIKFPPCRSWTQLSLASMT